MAKRSLRDQIGPERFPMLCHLIDLNNHVTTAIQEFVVNGGDIEWCVSSLDDARSALAKLPTRTDTEEGSA